MDLGGGGCNWQKLNLIFIIMFLTVYITWKWERKKRKEIKKRQLATATELRSVRSEYLKAAPSQHEEAKDSQEVMSLAKRQLASAKDILF